MLETTCRRLRVRRTISIVLSAAALLLPCIQTVRAQAYGIPAPEPIGPYLGGVFPSKAPGTSGTWAVANAFPNVTFQDPLQMVEIPGENKFLMAGKSGFLWVFDNDPATATKTEVLDIGDQVLQQEDAGLLGLVLHPEFGQSGSPNRGFLYLWYRYTPIPSHTGENAYVRLSRFSINAALDSIDRASELVMIQQYDRHDWHNGGGMFFGPDGFLYLTSGDEGGANDNYNSAQSLERGLFSGVLRIDVDQDPTRSHPIRRQPIPLATPPSGWPATFTQGYFIPNDNPWLDPGGSILEEFWAVGLRSPHRMTYDPVRGQIWVGDVGQGTREEISIAPRGANLQWPYREGTINGAKAKPSPLIGFDQPPVYDYPRSMGNCVIGGFVYRGTKWDTDLGGKYLFGDHGTRNVWTLTPDPLGGPPLIDFVLNVPSGGTGGKNGISSFATDSQGEVYVFKLFGTDLDGGIVYKLVQNNAMPEPPTFLSQLGAFDDLLALEPAAGVPYAVHTALWSDRADKRRWIVVPNDGAHDADSERILMRTYGDWRFPPGTVFIKHFDLPIDAREPDQLRRLETRFLVVDEDSEAYGLTYRWNAGQTDAQLLTTGETGDYAVYDEDGQPSTQTWIFPSRADCKTCHNANAGWVRGVNTHQLNGDFSYPASHVTDNQLRTWSHLGLLRPVIREADLDRLPSSVPVTHPTYDRAHRVRSYLDANCAQCHRPGGAHSSFETRFWVPLALQNLVDGPLIGDYGIPGAAVIKPQDPGASIALLRTSSTAADRMPPLATSVVHQDATRTLDEWIAELPPDDPLCDQLELPLPRTLLSFDSQEAGSPASHAIDGDPETFWHTEWVSADPPHPHELQIDLGASYDLSGLTYLPRQTASPNGTVADFTVWVSDDPGNWGAPVEFGTFPADQLESRFPFQATGRYVRFVAESEINGNPWTTVAELTVLKRPCRTGCASPGEISDLTLSSDVQGTSLTWTPSAGAGVVYDVVRSGSARDFGVPSCVESRDVDASAHDPTAPAAAEAFFYLVRGVDGCTGEVGPAGSDSAGSYHKVGLCPVSAPP